MKPTPIQYYYVFLLKNNAMKNTDFNYHNKEELDSFAGMHVEFLGFCNKPERRVLQKEVSKNNVWYWLPFCGLVDATTVKIRLLKFVPQ